MIGFAAKCLIKFEVGAKTGAEYAAEKSVERLAQRNGHRGRDWQTRAGGVELRIHRPRTGSYFPSFLEPRRSPDWVCSKRIQEIIPLFSPPAIGTARHGRRLVKNVGVS